MLETLNRDINIELSRKDFPHASSRLLPKRACRGEVCKVNKVLRPWNYRFKSQVNRTSLTNGFESSNTTVIEVDNSKAANHTSESSLTQVPLPTLTNSLLSSSCALSVTSTSSNDSSSSSFCKWHGCENTQEIGQLGLLSHIQQVHVTPQLTSQKASYVCLWTGCKVYGQPSVSSNWLSRHVLHHSEAKGKPFQCIFERCLLRFSSATLLERHISRDHAQNTGEKMSISTLIPEEGLTNDHNSSVHSCLGNANKRAATVKNCSRKNIKRRRKLRYYRVRRTDFYDFRSKTIIKNRLILDRMLAEAAFLRPSLGMAENEENSSDEDNVAETVAYTKLRLPFPIIDSPAATPSRRTLRSGSQCSALDSPEIGSPNGALFNKLNCYRIKLLLTVPHTFVGQRLSQEGKTEYLVKWQGDLCSETVPVMWVQEHEVRAASHLDRL